MDTTQPTKKYTLFKFTCSVEARTDIGDWEKIISLSGDGMRVHSIKDIKDFLDLQSKKYDQTKGGEDE